MRPRRSAAPTPPCIVLPYYNRPNQEGLYAHFAGARPRPCDLPIVVYNVPSRTVTDILPETMAQARRSCRTSSAIKDAPGNLDRVAAQRLACGADFVQLSGNDDMALGFNAMGGTGCISVTANVAPRLCADFQNACLDRRLGRTRSPSRTGSTRSTPPCSPTPRPGPVKYALAGSAPISPPSSACR